MKKERHRSHWDNQAIFLAGALEATDDFVALARRGIDGHEIVVVKVDAVRAHLTKQRRNLDRWKSRPHEIAEWIPAAITNRPKPERESVLRFRYISAARRAHGFLWILLPTTCL